MPALTSSASPVIALLPRGHPVLGPWRAALDRHHPTVAVWGADGADLRRLLVGLTPRDPAPPHVLPLAPGRRWTRWHAQWLQRKWPNAKTIVVTRPDQRPLLAWLSGFRVIYHAIDDYSTYGSDWSTAERELVNAARRIVGVSRSLAERLHALAPERPAADFVVLPNAIPEDWVPPAPISSAAVLPDRAGCPRPVAGVLGRVSSRLRLDWLVETIEATPWLHWLFVGDIEWSEVTPEDRPRIAFLRSHPRCRITGQVPFAAMRAFAAAIDVAVLPYSDRSTNPHGSPVRLFVHLPHPAPLLATPGCRQVEEFGDVVSLCLSAAALRTELDRQRANGFVDPHRETRWRLAHEHTWEARARSWVLLLNAIDDA